MFRGTATNLLQISPNLVKEWLNSFDSVLTDCDGVLWLHNEIISGSVETVNKFKEINKKVILITNNSTSTRALFWNKATKNGFNVTLDEVICTSHAAACYLKNLNFQKKVYVIGSSGLVDELNESGISNTGCGPDNLKDSLSSFVNCNLNLDPDIGAVVVAFDEHFSFPKMTKAASYLNNPECLFLATNTDERFPLPNYVIPGTGSIVRAVEVCAERNATVLGKPNPLICEDLIQNGIIDPTRTLMIGDRSNTDILLGKNCGFQTLLVGTGIHTMDDVKCWKESDNEDDKKLIPDVYLPRLGDLLQFM